MGLKDWKRGGASALLAVVLLACGDDGTAPSSDDILRFNVTLTGFVRDATGDSIAIENLAAELNVAQPESNGGNPVDIAFFSNPAPGTGATGIRMASHTRLSGPNTLTAGSVTGTVERNTVDAEVDVTMTPNSGACSTTPDHNLFSGGGVFRITSGRVLLNFPAGSASGSIVVNGTRCDGEGTALFSVTFAGGRL